MRTKYLISVISTFLVTLVAIGCGSDEQPKPSSGQFFELVHERGIDDIGELNHEAISQLRDANTESAFRFYRKLRTDSPNLIFSPLSFSRVLSSYYNGTREAAAFEALFGFTPNISTPRNWQQLLYQISNRDNHASVDEDKRSQFRATDIYWVDSTEGTSVGTANHDNFDRVHALPLSSQPEESSQAINQWVEEESEGLLVDFLEPGMINSNTNAIATNLVYFLGAWSFEFADADPITFKGLTGESQQEAFYGRHDTIASYSDGISVVQVRYAHEYSHWFFMPDNDFDEFANTLDATKFAALQSSTSVYNLSLTIPEFTANSRPDMGGAINALRAATQTEGDTLSGAYEESFAHLAAIEVSKEGTRAAAVSAVIEYGNSMPEPNPSLTITLDKPFVHAIICSRTGSILFLGEFTGK